MKTKPILKSLFAGSMALTLALSSCSSDHSNHQATGHDGHDSTTQAAQAVAVKIQDSNAEAVYQHYIHVKNALVKRDAKEAQAAASALQDAFTKAGNPKGADVAGKIASVSDVKAQRAELGALSAMAETVVRGQVKAGTIYKQYCPMANNGNGGYWLSSDPEVRNPYYGDEMLTCGEVKEKIQ